MEKYCTDRQDIDDYMVHAYCMLGTYTHTHYMKYLFLFHCNDSYENATHYYVVDTLPSLL
jgi:hypothetical protein